MSKYTTEVRFICERAAGLSESAGYASVNAIISKAIPVIFDFQFPMFDEKYRNVLCTKILRHYYTREISEETVGLWKLRLETKLNEIMPYYNQLYHSAALEFNPFFDVNLTTEHKGDKDEESKQDVSGSSNKTRVDDSTTKTVQADTGKRTGSGTSENNSTDKYSGNSRDLYSDTPQGALTNVEQENYLTNARKVLDDNTTTGTNNGKTSNTENTEYNSNRTADYDNTTTDTENMKRDTSGTVNTTESYIQTVKGKSSGISYSKLLKEFRETFLNIDMDIINELRGLFFGLW